jgi:oligo-1,6-glucosidase
VKISATLILVGIFAAVILPMQAQLVNGYATAWWKQAVVYQVYPRSFKDSNGDGVGDLPGLTSKLDYLKNLGVDVIWLSPHFDSPNADNGYDIRDYRKVMREFGTMQDFDAMLAGIKQRHMKLIIDLVVNHTSDEHAWFKRSRTSKSDPYRDYYIWRPGKNGGPPNNWTSFFSGSAWKLDSSTGEYYLHYFADKQPDLNWDNPKVRQEVYSVMKFWLDKGVDGFRMDVIPFVSKDPTFPDYPANFDGHPEFLYASGPKVHQYLQEMNREVLSKYDVMTVGEAFGVRPDQAVQFVDERRHELNTIFDFDIVRIDRDGWKVTSFTVPQLKAIYTKFDQETNKHSWNTVFLGNHDNPRAVSHFGNDSPQYRIASAKALAMMMLTQKGTPFIFQGEELGMTNYPFQKIEDFDDVEARNGWKDRVLSGQVSADLYLKTLRKMSRDNARTPMQWDSTAQGGFTAGPKPWLPVNPNFREINAAQEQGDPRSVYNFYRELLALRKKTPALIYGDYKDLDPQHPSVFAYTRVLGSDKFVMTINLSNKATSYRLPAAMSQGKQVLNNLGRTGDSGGDLHLEAWEARIYQF